MTKLPGSRRAFVFTGVTACGLAAAGCIPSLPGQKAAPTTHRLTQKSTFDDLPDVTWTLTVAEPTAERSLDTNRIAVVRDGTTIDYYANASWSDRAPAMIQSLMVASFRSQRQYR